MSKISELSDGGNVQDGDTLIAVRSGGNVKVTYDTDNVTFGSVTMSGDLAVDTDTLFVDVSSGNVGIGTSSPARTLHIADSVPAWRLEDTAVAGLFSEFNSTADGTWQFKVDQGNVQANSALAFVVDSAEAMRIDDGGNVKIASGNLEFSATQLNYTISVPDAAANFFNPNDRGNITIQASNSTSGSQAMSGGRVLINGGDSNNGQTGDIVLSTGANLINASNSGVIRFNIGGTASGNEAARIDSSGNVGIGTSSPNERLEVYADSGTGALCVTSAVSTTNTTGANLLFRNLFSTGTGATASIGIETGSTLDRGSLVFSTASISNAPSERMRIDSSGNLLVGTTTLAGQGGLTILPLNSQGSAVCLFNRANTSNSSTALAFQNNGSTVGTIRYNNTTTFYNTSSDVRLKENITDAPQGTVDALQVRSFDWKADGSHQEYGFVAQELEPVAPYAVTKGDTEDDMWSVDYSKLVPMLVKEIQDLKARIATLEAN